MKNSKRNQSVSLPMNDNMPSPDTNIDILPPINHCRKNKKLRRRGGYGERGTLTKKDRKIIDHYLKLIAELGPRAVWLISINPKPIDGERPPQRKARIRSYVSYIGTILRRSGNIPSLLSVYEWPHYGTLHAHVVVHIPKASLEAVRQFIEKHGIWEESSTGERYGEILHAIPFNPTRHHSYITKERTYPCKPQEWKPSRLNQFRPRPGVRFKGKRVCPSNGLLKKSKQT